MRLRPSPTGRVLSPSRPHPALRTLARLKLRASIRSLRRRLSHPSGIFFALVGVLVFGLWIFSMAVQGRASAPIDFAPELRIPTVCGALAMLTVMTLVGALSYRGLYLPRDEIERLLSAPVSRVQIVRYRLSANLARSSFFALIMAFLAGPRMPVFGFAFAGMLVATLTLPLLGQGASLLCGGAENWLGRALGRVPPALFRIVAGIGAGVLIVPLFFWGDLAETGADLSLFDDPSGLLLHPAFSLLTRPFVPWASAISAESWREFLPWFGVSLLMFVVCFELVTHIRVDFRTLSLETSADVARRIRRVRSGGNLVSGARASRRSVGWRIPWLFGRGPFGAVAWLKMCTIVRKSRGTVIYSILVIAFVIFLTSIGGIRELQDPTLGAILIATLGTIYLGSGLRFDFRSDLDLMPSIKAWPLAPWRLFLATILPEVLLVCALVIFGILMQALISGELPLSTWAVICAVPVVGTLWIAIDNTVFLLAPVRFVPGQGNTMHHTGRAMVMVFVRILLAGALAALCALAAYGVGLMADRAGLEPLFRSMSMGLVVVVILAAVGTGTIAVGGWALGRFDVARDRG
ncbi:MAG: hypothetical protein ACI8QZ_004179 [Chlamydiales bacterium]|jgi:hypothetical protein